MIRKIFEKAIDVFRRPIKILNKGGEGRGGGGKRIGRNNILKTMN